MKILVGGTINGVSNLNIPASTCAFRISQILKIGGYDQNFRRLEDAELFIRVCANNLSISWSPNVGVVRHSTFSPDKGGALESNFEALLLSKYAGLLSGRNFRKCSFQIKLRRYYFDRNAVGIFVLLIANPLQTIANIHKIQGFAKRILHDLRISGSA